MAIHPIAGSKPARGASPLGRPPRRSGDQGLVPAAVNEALLLASRLANLARHALNVFFSHAFADANLFADDFLLHQHLLVPRALAVGAYFAVVAAVMVKQAPQRWQL